MTDDVMQAAMTTWAAKDLPARLLAGQMAKLLNCTVDDVAILVSAGKLHALGKPRPNAVKFFSTVELIALLADRLSQPLLRIYLSAMIACVKLTVSSFPNPCVQLEALLHFTVPAGDGVRC